jgi:hypothetical protein
MRIPLIMLVSFAIVSPLAGQWYVGVEFGVNTYRGSTHDTSSTHVASDGRPGGGTTIGVSVSRNWKALGVTVRGSYAEPGFVVAGSGITVTDKTTGRLIELASMISTKVGGIGPSGALRVELGPALHLWDFNGQTHSGWGALGGAAYEWVVAGRLTGAIRLEGMLSPSWFDATDVPPEFERRATWRYGVGLGLRYRL